MQVDAPTTAGLDVSSTAPVPFTRLVAVDPGQADQQVLLLGGGAELRGDGGEVVQPTLDQVQGCGVGAGHASKSSTDHRH